MATHAMKSVPTSPVAPEVGTVRVTRGQPLAPDKHWYRSDSVGDAVSLANSGQVNLLHVLSGRRRASWTIGQLTAAANG
jgi:hypothetical protein